MHQLQAAAAAAALAVRGSVWLISQIRQAWRCLGVLEPSWVDGSMDSIFTSFIESALGPGWVGWVGCESWPAGLTPRWKCRKPASCASGCLNVTQEFDQNFWHQLWFFMILPFFSPKNISTCQKHQPEAKKPPDSDGFLCVFGGNSSRSYPRLTLPPSRGIALPQVVGQVQVWRQDSRGFPWLPQTWLAGKSHQKWRFSIIHGVLNGRITWDRPKERCWISSHAADCQILAYSTISWRGHQAIPAFLLVNYRLPRFSAIFDPSPFRDLR